MPYSENRLNGHSKPFTTRSDGGAQLPKKLPDANWRMSRDVKRSSNSVERADEVWMLLTQAGICCEEARQAASRHRFRAACGLFSTAILLYRMLLRHEDVLKDSSLRLQIEEQARHIESEKAVHANLCDQWQHGRNF